MSKEKHNQPQNEEGKTNDTEDSQKGKGEDNRLLVARNHAINSQNEEEQQKMISEGEVDIGDDNDLEYTATITVADQNKGDASPRQIATVKKVGRQNKRR
ncbi:hypothetical protein K7X08_016323 [Anisodus acutangulus]|uniref:Uncharacterized protein n=1 Tax=Anisodus acutangulus TaxID=402998 RepID=A0A9Q1LH28_9SOLA|nr:hypothetical protein K7X08_016323 [Anisodus acutangulus]